MRTWTKAALGALLVVGACAGVGSADPVMTQPINFEVAVEPVMRVDYDALPGARNDRNVPAETVPWTVGGPGAPGTDSHVVEANVPVQLTLTAEAPYNAPAADIGGHGAKPARQERDVNGNPMGPYDYLDATYQVTLDLSSTSSYSDPNALLSPWNGSLLATPKSLVVQDNDGEFSFTVLGEFASQKVSDAGQYYARILVTITALPPY